MSTLRTVVASAAIGLFVTAATAADKPATALESDPAGWIDLFPGPDLKGWKRVPILPDTQLTMKNAWSVAPDGKTLLCDGFGVKEMLLHDVERGDGIFHLEWRFRRIEQTRLGYNGGAYVRTRPDATTWFQIQVAELDKPPMAGDIFAEMRSGGEPKKLLIQGKGASLVNPPGEWNTYEITCKGSTITAAINGQVATTWTDCPSATGSIGMQAEYYFIEFRNLKFKPLSTK